MNIHIKHSPAKKVSGFFVDPRNRLLGLHRQAIFFYPDKNGLAFTWFPSKVRTEAILLWQRVKERTDPKFMQFILHT